MYDKITIERIKLLHPIIRDEVLNAYYELFDNNIYIRITQSFRSFDEQNKLYEQGRSTPGIIITKAKPGLSYHNYGLAFDFCLINPIDQTISWDWKSQAWSSTVQLFKDLNYKWGGDFPGKFKDYPHLEKRGYSIRQLYNLYQNNKRDNNGYVIIK